jgi:hypothetical protein
MLTLLCADAAQQSSKGNCEPLISIFTPFVFTRPDFDSECLNLPAEIRSLALIA